MIVAVFGGSFNPPHVAHVLAVTLVLSAHEVDRVLVVPAFKHPFAKSLAPFADRARMAELAMGWLPGAVVSRVEEDLGGESRTLRTLEHLRTAHPEWTLRLVVGADILVEAHKWHGFDAIQGIAPLLVLGRAGFTSKGAPAPLLPEISSTEVRAKLESRRPSDLAELSGLVPRAVLAYIAEKGLYAAP